VSTERTGIKHSLPLALMGAFAMLWVVARACVQSITIDEADTYLAYVLRPGLSHWDAGANNHVLNSLLMRLVTMIFGASAIGMRVPALLGSACISARSIFWCCLFRGAPCCGGRSSPAWFSVPS